MTPPQTENTKICPVCGANQINSAQRCIACGTVFKQLKINNRPPHRMPRVTVSLPLLVAVIVGLLVVNSLAILGWQKRGEVAGTATAVNVTSTYKATIYISPTVPPTRTATPAPPTATIEPDVTYKVVSGDSCIAIATRFKVSLDSLVAANKVDCGALSIGLELKIPKATPTPEPSDTPGGTRTP